MHDVDAVNAGYARLLLESYLDDPDSVPLEWQTMFERGDAIAGLPGLDRVLSHHEGATRVILKPAAAPRPAAVPPPLD